MKCEIEPKIVEFDFQILEIQMPHISILKQILKVYEMKNAKIHFSKFEIYMAQSIHGFELTLI